jgi:hypothetical protein
MNFACVRRVANMFPSIIHIEYKESARYYVPVLKRDGGCS